MMPGLCAGTKGRRNDVMALRLAATGGPSARWTAGGILYIEAVVGALALLVYATMVCWFRSAGASGVTGQAEANIASPGPGD
jgi:hypothetical protein